MKPWTPEVEVTLDKAHELIAMQFPALLPLEIEFLDSGWDNVVYLVNQKWYFRFPQRKIAVEGVVREMDCLPVIQKVIGMAPDVQFRGKATESYPFPFFGYLPRPGVEACRVQLSKEDRLQMAEDLGRSLKKLHSKELHLELLDQLPFDPLDRLHFPKRVAQTEGRLLELQKMKINLAYEALLKILRESLKTPRLPPSAVVHGDLHFRHIIVSSDLRLSGLIDWGDLHRNSPAVDLQLFWSYLPGSAARRCFLSHYGAISEVELIQARSFGVFVNIALLQYSLDIENEFIQSEAILALENILIEAY